LRQTDRLIRARAARNANEVIAERLTLGQRLADRIAAFGGSWRFISLFGVVLIAWMTINSIAQQPFDPFPFILLNLVLSSLAALQAPVIMMSQNRADAKDRIRSELDYQVNLKAETEIAALHEKVDALREELLRSINVVASHAAGGEN
jgi:CRP/FNR family cyclic AMP-dependent transcriptional regulator